MRQDGLGKFFGRELGALYVHMPVYQTGYEVFPRRVDLRLARILSDADDSVADNGDVPLFDLLREYVDDLRPFDDEIGLLPPRGGVDFPFHFLFVVHNLVFLS